MSDDDRMPSRDERIELCEGRVTLDGKPAVVSGYNLPYARVTQLGGLSAEWSWQAVRRVRANGGRFTL